MRDAVKFQSSVKDLVKRLPIYGKPAGPDQGEGPDGARAMRRAEVVAVQKRTIADVDTISLAEELYGLSADRITPTSKTRRIP